MADFIRINFTEDNFKNEYNANCMTRITVQETKFEKRKREKNGRENGVGRGIEMG